MEAGDHMSLPIPFPQGAVNTRGAAAGSPVTVPGIRATDKLLALVKHVDTSGANLYAIWTEHQ